MNILTKILNELVNTNKNLVTLYYEAETLRIEIKSYYNSLIFSMIVPGNLVLCDLTQVENDKGEPMFQFKLKLPACEKPTLTSGRTVKYTATDSAGAVASGEQPGIAVAADKTDFFGPFEVGVVFAAKLYDHDPSGNISEPSDEFDWTVVDTVAPSKPGVMSISDLTEVS